METLLCLAVSFLVSHRRFGGSTAHLAALSTRWDWYLTQEPLGKVVWCELAADLTEPTAGAKSPPQALLPRRVRRTPQKQPVEAMNDPEILRRVRDRLRDPDGSNLPVWPNLPTIWT